MVWHRIKKEILIFLIIILTFSVLSTIVTALIVEHIYGSDQIEGMIAEQDTITAEIRTAAVITQVTMNDLDVCVKAGATFNCQLEHNVGDTNDFTFISYQNELAQEYKDISVVIDNLAPIINNYEVSTSELGINFEFQTSDALIVGRCGGFEKIEFFANDIVIKEINYSKDDNECTKEISQEMNYETGADFKVRITDKLGNSVESEEEFINITKAVISNLNFEYEGEPITRISSNNPITGTATFYITAKNLEQVTANFSQLVQNPMYQQAYSSMNIPLSSCHLLNNYYKTLII